ncbi:site-specific integrase [Dactylosporangium sp. NPDC005572]|uniref:tyrosine-type recombinase/integrase n=1 Tax=Dactylosporangium sp. NPDC005572 TaxID=3156889 RepID=UPI0033BC835C
MAEKRRRFGRVRQLPSGQWQARYKGPDGKDHPAPTTFATERLAEKYLSVVEGDIAQGRWISPTAGKTTVAEWADRWYRSAMSRWKPKTRESYRSVLDRLIGPHLGRVKLSALKPIMVSNWVGKLSEEVSASQVRQAYRLLSQVMTSAVNNDMIPVTPCRGVRLPRLPEADPRILTVEQVNRLSAICEPVDRVLVLLLAYGGLRIGEALALRRRHLDVENGRVVVAEAVTQLVGGPVIGTPKSHQRRALTLPTFVVELVGELLGNLPEGGDVFLFGGRQRHTQDRQQSYHGFRRRFRVAVTAAGLGDVTPHDLRATHASWVADSHGVLVAARRLGHANASVTTRHYARAMDGADDHVAMHLDEVARDASVARQQRKDDERVPNRQADGN